jgi:hypothetical protein
MPGDCLDGTSVVVAAQVCLLSDAARATHARPEAAQRRFYRSVSTSLIALRSPRTGIAKNSAPSQIRARPSGAFC